MLRNKKGVALALSFLTASGFASALPQDKDGPTCNWSRRLDFGPALQAVAPGFEGIEPGDSYPQFLPNDPLGFGFTTTGETSFNAGNPMEEQMRNLHQFLMRDGVESSSNTEVRIDVPGPGTYSLRLYLGRLGEDLASSLAPTEPFRVLINGSSVVEDLFARFPVTRGGYSGAKPNYRRLHFQIDATTSSTVLITLGNAADAETPILGLELLANFERPPVVFSSATNTLQSNSNNDFIDGLVQPALNLMQGTAPDYAASWSQLLALSNNASPNVRLAAMWGMSWWIGWLRGEEDMGWKVEGGAPLELANLSIVENGLLSLSTIF